ncbi:hypothetical protein EB1_34890 [Empedobacter brevis NBRC 14943 = ATCC 43319]|uniref:Peptidase C51 domain-containing protein n=2 Tax=Empedobacter brevis TaxID=247 RepID=A0A511NLM6_9FLAO|nr:hypothetical protein EB1_34890 [Empedobacter brevis NBRC 14943 = ATCC 43319]
MGGLKGILELGGPPTAGQWGDPDVTIRGWEVVSKPQAGDIVAYKYGYSDATGHVAIMISQTHSIGTSGTYNKVSVTDFGSNKNHLPDGSTYVYRRYVGSVFSTKSGNNPWRAYP